MARQALRKSVQCEALVRMREESRERDIHEHSRDDQIVNEQASTMAEEFEIEHRAEINDEIGYLVGATEQNGVDDGVDHFIQELNDHNETA